MSRLLAASFAHEDDIRGATTAARRMNWRIVDVYAPYPVHGLDSVMGLPPSRLGRVAFVLGGLGTALALWFQTWANSVNWPLNVGGRPFNSWPAFVPVAFEVMVLSAGLGVVLAFLLRCRLFPGKKPAVLPGVTDDRFVLVVEEENAAFDARVAQQLFRACGAIETFEWEEPDRQQRRYLSRKEGM